MTGREPRGTPLSKDLRNFVSESFLNLVLVGFLSLAALNLVTFFWGSNSILMILDARSWGAILDSFVFDSWGTLAGLLGAVILFLPVLLGSPVRYRATLSIFFFALSVSIGVGSSLLWNYLFDAGESPSFGSSAIDIAAQSIIFTLAIFALVRSFQSPSEGVQQDGYVRNSFRIIYATLIVTTLWFILFLQPVFVPTALFNWRVHEIAFLSGIFVTTAYLSLRALRERNLEKSMQSEDKKLLV